ncbi:MAG: flagellar basal body rod protein FlgC [Aestuariivirga sp.]|uniref:flagellar basal body rod protein FlgC n=1 Tax=Aestuariivirga sp. TaxID=2650926 RepID=UPI0025C65332|nr:flagellar basal body rod protein FlgC [Aestuariivirga sp.]MCA3561416.1 flagellar basal body rod protein FlgC [Aestuariivirga sp.]
MLDPLLSVMRTASSGLQSQSMRLKVVSENLANMDSTGTTPGADPYRRKMVTFTQTLDEATGAQMVGIDRIIRDQKPFKTEYDPGHPAADASGYVKRPNVEMMVEMADMREASRSYEANLQMIKQAREMTALMVDLLKGQ